MAFTKNTSDIIKALIKDPAVQAPLDEGHFPFAVDVMFNGQGGLHARSATEFSQVARLFPADICVRYAGRSANGKSLASLLSLGLVKGAVARILTRGHAAEEALSTLEKAVADGLGEGQEGNQEEAEDAADIEHMKGRERARHSSKANFSGDVRRGIAASPGIAIAPAFLLEKSIVRINEAAGRYQDERNTLINALIAARGELQKLGVEGSAGGGSQHAAIFLAHQDLMDDGVLLEESNELLKQGLAAAVAYKMVMERREAELAALKGDRLAEGVQDVRAVLDRVLRLLGGDTTASIMKRLPNHPVILVADDLAPSEIVSLDPRRVLGVATISGSKASHTARLARRLGIPSIVGLGQAAMDIISGSQMIIDGDRGLLVIDPREADLALAKKIATALAEDAHRAKLEAYLKGLINPTIAAREI